MLFGVWQLLRIWLRSSVPGVGVGFVARGGGGVSLRWFGLRVRSRW
jgi:hypothetical protein